MVKRSFLRETETKKRFSFRVFLAFSKTLNFSAFDTTLKITNFLFVGGKRHSIYRRHLVVIMLQSSARKVRAMSGLGASCSRSVTFATGRSLSSSSSFQHIKDKEDFWEKNVWNVPLIRGNCADYCCDDERKKRKKIGDLRRTMTTTKIAMRGFASSSSKSYSKDDETSNVPETATILSTNVTKSNVETKSKRRAFRKKGVSDKTFDLNDQELFEDAPPTELKPNVQVAQYESRNDERSLKAVSTAISANTAILFCKLGGYAVSGSPSMLAESVHSVADIANQALLRYGIVSSKRKPDATHNYGYHRERFVWSLISATGVFFLGSGLSISHGVNALTATGGPQAAEKPEISLAILGASLALEAYSAYVAYDALKLNAMDRGMTVTQFIKSGRDPTSVSVLAEDAAAVAGCAVAGAAILAANITGIHAFDAAGSICIGGLLGVTAMYLINSNRLMLLGKSLGQDKMSLLNEKMRKDPVVSEVYLAKSEELGPGTFRYAAELEFDGTAIVNRFLDKDNNREAFREEFKRGVLENDSKVIDDALVGYGRRVIISVGDEVDRIEREIVELEPTIKYVDLETN